MKNLKSRKSKSTIKPRSKRRYFTEASRKAIVLEIEKGMSKAEAARKYEVSETTIYKWLRIYSKEYSPTLTTRVEHESDSEKNKMLNVELSKVYETLGRSQAENMLLRKIIEVASEDLGIDLKKTFENQPLATSTSTKKIPL